MKRLLLISLHKFNNTVLNADEASFFTLIIEESLGALMKYIIFVNKPNLLVVTLFI